MHANLGSNADVTTGRHLYLLHFPEAGLPIVRYQPTLLVNLAPEASVQFDSKSTFKVLINCAYLPSKSYITKPDSSLLELRMLFFASRSDDILFV
jgi:hypothetical protein